MNASQLLIVRRRHAGNFTQIPNTLIRNPELGSKSLGVIVHLLSLPPGFRISLESLCRARKEGETAMRTAIRKSIPQFMSSLLRKAREGKFSLSAGAALRKNLLQIIRRQKALEAVVKPTPVETGTEPPMDRAQQRERLRQLREELARKAHTQVIPVGRP